MGGPRGFFVKVTSSTYQVPPKSSSSKDIAWGVNLCIWVDTRYSVYSGEWTMPRRTKKQQQHGNQNQQRQRSSCSYGKFSGTNTSALSRGDIWKKRLRYGISSSPRKEFAWDVYSTGKPLAEWETLNCKGIWRILVLSLQMLKEFPFFTFDRKPVIVTLRTFRER